MSHFTTGSVLLIDDDESAPQLWRIMLERAGHSIYGIAENSVEALVMMKLNDTLPDLIITGLIIPEMDATDLLHHLRGTVRYRHIPVIVVSSRLNMAEERLRDACIDPDSVTIFTSPLSFDNALKTINTLIAQSKASTSPGSIM